MSVNHNGYQTSKLMVLFKWIVTPHFIIPISDCVSAEDLAEKWRKWWRKKKRWCGGLKLDMELVSVSQWHTVNIMVICWYRQGNDQGSCSGSIYSYQLYPCCSQVLGLKYTLETKIITSGDSDFLMFNIKLNTTVRSRGCWRNGPALITR